MADAQTKIQHLTWRAGFGPRAADLKRLRNSGLNEFQQRFFKASAGTPSFLEALSNPVEEGSMEDVFPKKRQVTEQERKDRKQVHFEAIKKLNRLWLAEMINSDAQLREKMAFFWHDHFACRTGNALHLQQYLHILRTNALGKFSDLLVAVSKSAAMINYLNSNLNKKGKPNENFAREVMELFSIGKGNYTEDDVKEAARAFTGWTTDYEGRFIFKAEQHDAGSKKFLGHTGNFSGDDILQLLLKEKNTARFIVEKIYRYFVNEITDDKRVNQLTDTFYTSGYDIGKLMYSIFSSEWFFRPEHIGSRIKSPIELWVGINRQLPMQFSDPDAAFGFQRVLGQVLFQPPNVAGWPSGNAWIDSSSLMFRLRLPLVLSAGTSIDVSSKPDDDIQMGKKDQPVRGMRATIQWAAYFNVFKDAGSKELPALLNRFLLQTSTGPSETILEKYSKNDSREAFLSSRSLLLMQCPEYQYC
ncbi:DUF1800 domain-containing protein [Flavihumibacter sp. CACIAM 22H1]|uniref:DUF1800 domain-containing protein n=1 Tax=Flavihumibacter sp. CACIAM 22H1 TaxID=1812911 RepID=UPI0007A80C52|nr:DUF1800 domain-containing protein [Flavihumibacter sp. CACIAM 22H1]KYP13847.1 MAG: hypothetical protein A1D16_12245 [Flavihumibacter sp. CACIAM 22H1]